MRGLSIPRISATPVAAVILVFAAGFGLSAWLLHHTAALRPHDFANLNLWFEADVWRVFQNLTDRNSDHYRTAVHPLASLFLTVPTLVLMKLGASAELAAYAVMAAGAGTLAAAFFVLLYRLHGRLLDALVFTALLITSSAFVLFTAVPENYAWGGASIVLALVAASYSGPFSSAALVAANVLTLSFTVTNWMAGILAARVQRPWRSVILYAALGLALVAALSALQVYLFPTAGRFLSIKEEESYLVFEWAQRIREVTGAFFVNAMTLVWFGQAVDHVGNPYVTAQHGPHMAGPKGVAAALLWLGVLGAGVWNIVRRTVDAPLTQRIGWLVLVLVLGQYLLHLVYGSETALYSLHFLPLLIVAASFAARGRWRPWVLGAAALLLALSAWTNASQYARAFALADELLLQNERPPHRPRDQVLDAMAQRPNDPWPRGEGHMPIGLPGAPEVDKGYVEPGGAFSPSVGSFGLAVWKRGPGGALVTSDDVPLDQTRQAFETDGPAVALRTITPFFTGVWRQAELGSWTLSLTPSDGPVELVLRSVGPAGGRVESLRRDGAALIVNERWVLRPQSGLRLIDMGEEGGSGWRDRRNLTTKVEVKSGWGVARFETTGDDVRLRIDDLKRQPSYSPLQTLGAASGVRIEGGDPQFNAALEAQVAQLLIGSVGVEARPGDPTHYPLAWQRDAAYVVVSLVSAGRLDAAEVLVEDVAKRDFFGGFGPEADAPGLGLWAIGTVSRANGDTAFLRRHWPDVHRKAEFILTMLQAKEWVPATATGPVLSEFAANPEIGYVAEPAKDGLIIGRMDWHRPSLYVSAVSLRGLEEAVRIARVLGETRAAERWDAARVKLQAAYRAALARGEQLDNDRTLIGGLSPTFAAEGLPQFVKALEADWAKSRTVDGGFKAVPPWTYFELGKARQWLMLGRPERTWETLRWFWAHSPAPGLYSQWEGEREEHHFGRWQATRGWVRPTTVTPALLGGGGDASDPDRHARLCGYAGEHPGDRFRRRQGLARRADAGAWPRHRGRRGQIGAGTAAACRSPFAIRMSPSGRAGAFSGAKLVVTRRSCRSGGLSSRRFGRRCGLKGLSQPICSPT